MKILHDIQYNKYERCEWTQNISALPIFCQHACLVKYTDASRLLVKEKCNIISVYKYKSLLKIAWEVCLITFIHGLGMYILNWTGKKNIHPSSERSLTMYTHFCTYKIHCTHFYTIYKNIHRQQHKSNKSCLSQCDTNQQSATVEILWQESMYKMFLYPSQNNARYKQLENSKPLEYLEYVPLKKQSFNHLSYKYIHT